MTENMKGVGWPRHDATEWKPKRDILSIREVRKEPVSDNNPVTAFVGTII